MSRSNTKPPNREIEMSKLRLTVRSQLFRTTLAAASVLVVAAVGRAADVEIKESHMKYNGMKYFRANSENVQIGSTGRKLTPVFGINSIEVHDHLPQNKLHVKSAAIVEIDFTKSSEKDIMAGVNKPGVFKGHQPGHLHGLHQPAGDQPAPQRP